MHLTADAFRVFALNQQFTFRVGQRQSPFTVASYCFLGANLLSGYLVLKLVVNSYNEKKKKTLQKTECKCLLFTKEHACHPYIDEKSKKPKQAIQTLRETHP